MDAFGGDANPASRLTAEVLEYEVLVPGRPSRVERRALFDWLGPAARAGRDRAAIEKIQPPSGEMLLDLATTTDILILGAQPSVAFAQHAVGASMVRAGRATVKMTRDPASADQTLAELARDAPPVPALLSLALARRQWSRFADRMVLARPNILTAHSGLRADAETGFEPWTAFDIVANDVDILGQGDQTDAAALRLEQGVLDTNAEAFLAGAGSNSSNPSDLMNGPRAAPSAWTPVVKTAVPAASAEWPTDMRARVLSELDRGFAAVVPAESDPSLSTTSWWRVDPTTGITVGIGNRGWGQAMKEYVQMIRLGLKSISAGACFFKAYHKGSWGKAAACALGATLGSMGLFKLGPLEGGLFGALGDVMSVAGAFF